MKMQSQHVSESLLKETQVQAVIQKGECGNEIGEYAVEQETLIMVCSSVPDPINFVLGCKGS